MDPVTVAAMLSLTMCTAVLAGMVVMLTLRVLPPRPVAQIAAERRAAYRYATDVAEGHGPHDDRYRGYGGGDGFGFRPAGPSGHPDR